MEIFAGLRRLRAARRAERAARILDHVLHRPDRKNGPPAIAAARAQCHDRPDILIAPLETRFAFIGDRIAVRAWLLISEADASPDLREVSRRSVKAFEGASHIAEIFFLSASYGIRSGDIAVLLGLSRRRVRQLLLEAIARVHRAFGDHRPATGPNDMEGSGR